MINLERVLNRLKNTKPSVDVLVVFVFFLVCMLADFTVTAVMSGGDSTLEGNKLAVFLWNTLGPLRHFDYIAWPIYVFCITYIFNAFSRFAALWWVYGIGFAHVLGATTWFTYEVANYFYRFAYSLFSDAWVYQIPLTLVGLVLGCVAAGAHCGIGMYFNQNSVPI